MNTKRRSNLIQITVLVLLGGLVVLSLVMPALPIDFREQTVEVSVLMREAEGDIWSNTRLGMEQAAYDMGGELRFLMPEADNSHTVQSAILQREIQGGTDTLVVVPADPAAMEQMLAEYAAELPVVTMESPLARARSCITPDNEALGQQLARACNADGKTVLLLDTAGKSTGVRQRVQACAETLGALGATAQTRQVSAAHLKDALEEMVQATGADVVIAFEPSATEGMLAAKDSLPEAVELYGVGDTPQIVAALEQQTVQQVAAWSDYAVGYLAVKAAIDAKRGVKLEHNNYHVRFSLVKGEDIYDETNQKLLFPVVN